jgi:hypothetical protein
MNTMHRAAIRTYTFIALAAALLLAPANARAQFQPREVSDPATGENYHIEGAFGFWLSPTTEMQIESTALGIAGSKIDFVTDLGLQDHTFREFHLTAKGGSSKFRLQYIPLVYEQSSVIQRTIVFNGQAYNVGLPVNSVLDWKAWRIGYENDFIVKDRGFGGFIVDVKYTDVNASLASPIRSDFVHAQAPIPTIGGIFRVYPAANVAITGEITGFTLGWAPESIRGTTNGHYADFDFYGTVNFTNNFGVQGGYRRLDVGYELKNDAGAFTVKGIYFNVVARY